jgi:2-hydroxy-3-oxopropionate reductase
MKEKIGFIGLGAMGFSMAKNVMKKGYHLTAYDIDQKRLEAITGFGAIPVASAKKVPERSDIIITMVPSSSHAREAILGEEGVIRGVREGAIVIDMSTIPLEQTTVSFDT